MNLAQFAVEIRRRAGFVPDLPDERLEETVGLLGVLAHAGEGEEASAVREVLVALIHSDHESNFNSATLDALTRESLRRLEVLLDALLNGWYTTERLRAALRPALVRNVK